MKEKKEQKKKKRGLSIRNRTNLAYLFLSCIIIFLITLLILIPRSETEIVSDSETVSGTGQKDIESQEQTTDTTQVSVQKPEEIPFRGYLYLVLDDVGYSMSQLESFLELPIPITYSILPRLDKTEETYRRIIESGNEVMLHQPVEPIGDQDPGPGALYVTMDPKEIRSTMIENLSQLPKAVGVNNHMGSRGTTDELLMRGMMEAIQGTETGLFYIDSRTTAESVVDAVAERMKVPHSRRNVFLDNEPSRESIEKALEESLKIAETQGYAVMIGHVWSEELAATLSLWYADIRARGFEFEYISTHFAEEVAHVDSGS